MEKRRAIPILLLFLTICIWGVTLWGRLELLKTSRELLAAENELQTLRLEQRVLLSRLNEPMELSELEEKALQLGMALPRPEQLCPAEGVLPDVIVISEPEGILNGKNQELLDRIRSCFTP